MGLLHLCVCQILLSADVIYLRLAQPIDYAWRLITNNLAAGEEKKKRKWGKYNRSAKYVLQAERVRSEREDHAGRLRDGAFRWIYLLGRNTGNLRIMQPGLKIGWSQPQLWVIKWVTLRVAIDQGCDYVDLRRGEPSHALKENILILGPVNGTFASRYRFSHATAIAAICAACIFTCRDQPRNKLRSPGKDLGAPSKRAPLPPSCRTTAWSFCRGCSRGRNVFAPADDDSAAYRNILLTIKTDRPYRYYGYDPFDVENPPSKCPSSLSFFIKWKKMKDASKRLQREMDRNGCICKYLQLPF